MGICTSCNKQVAKDETHVCSDAYAYLGSTDWVVIKHRDQVDSGKTPDLTTEEYQAILAQRQAARDTIKASEA